MPRGIVANPQDLYAGVRVGTIPPDRFRTMFGTVSSQNGPSTYLVHWDEPGHTTCLVPRTDLFITEIGHNA